VPRFAVALLVTGALSCTDDTPRVQLDVIIDADDTLTVYATRLDVTCAYSTRLILDGTCGEAASDAVGADCEDRGGVDGALPELGCLQALETIDGGALEYGGGGTFRGPAGTSLRVTGCEGETIIPLDVDAPTLSGVRSVARSDGAAGLDTDTAGIAATVDADGASHTQLCSGLTFATQCCDSTSASVLLPVPCTVPSETTVSVLSAPVEHDAATGPVRVWARTTTPFTVPVAAAAESDDDGVLVAPACASTLLRVETASQTRLEVLFDEIAYDADAGGGGGSTFSLSAGSTTLILGRDVDELHMNIDGDRLVATIVHEATPRTMAVDDVTGDAITVAIAPVEVSFAREDEPSVVVTTAIVELPPVTLPVLAR
jgi:hypothetical protein